MHRFHYFIISACMLFTSCNKDEVITEEVGGQPIIELDSETGIYTVKVDHELTIAPTYQNVEDALFAWTIDGTLVSSGPSLQRTWNECGDFYVKLRVDNAEGYAEEELKVEVKELTPPVISLALPSQGLKVVRNTDYTFTPDIQHSDIQQTCVPGPRAAETTQCSLISTSRFPRMYRKRCFPTTRNN